MKSGVPRKGESTDGRSTARIFREIVGELIARMITLELYFPGGERTRNRSGILKCGTLLIFYYVLYHNVVLHILFFSVHEPFPSRTAITNEILLVNSPRLIVQ